MRTCVVIPSYKAEKTLAPTIARIPLEVLAGGGIVVVINDASPDGTGQAAEALAAQNPSVRVVHHSTNKGYGGAQKTGLRFGLENGCDAFAVVHSDGQYAPEKLPELLEPIRTGKAWICLLYTS
ncbi:MAG: glycosyltransferase family 2 protein, partial [Terrimicrobiaceae bacterium]|nr:glycosyltransferase family 2 protein [Terrimicrobiaceae bacterium]